MKKSILAALATLALGLAAAPTASAAVEVGNDCPVSSLLGGVSAIQLEEAPGNPLPIVVPTAGIVTRWRIGWVSEEPGAQVLEVYRPTSTPNQFTLVAESAIGKAVHGQSTFETRIPVQGGDVFGLSGEPGSATCITESPADVIGLAIGTVPPGFTQTFGPFDHRLLSVVATVEPDADGDGYGDETQDRCPQSAQIHEACPPLTLSFYSIAQKSSAIVLVSAGVPSQITVSAKVPGVPKKKRAGSSATIKLKPVTHLANPGQITKYKLKFTGPLKAALADLPPSKSLALKVKASGANLAGLVKSEERTLRLKGQG